MIIEKWLMNNKGTHGRLSQHAFVRMEKVKSLRVVKESSGLVKGRLRVIMYPRRMTMHISYCTCS